MMVTTEDSMANDGNMTTDGISSGVAHSPNSVLMVMIMIMMMILKKHMTSSIADVTDHVLTLSF